MRAVGICGGAGWFWVAGCFFFLSDLFGGGWRLGSVWLLGVGSGSGSGVGGGLWWWWPVLFSGVLVFKPKFLKSSNPDLQMPRSDVPSSSLLFLGVGLESLQLYVFFVESGLQGEKETKTETGCEKFYF